MIPGILYIVATPIGSLDDITFRAVEVLRSVDLIACEDTRRSRVLLDRWGVTTSVISLHRFSENRKSRAVIERLERGESVAVITDAGTPAVSDPGHRIVRAVLDAGLRVVPIPGPSSVTAALSVAGSDASTFVYLGFVPRKTGERRTFFREIRGEARTTIFFETARRASATLEVAAEELGSRRTVMLRELTKLHEEIFCGTAQSLRDELRDREHLKGEIVFVVEGARSTQPEMDVEDAVKALMGEGLSGTRLAAEAQRRFGIRKSEAYAKYLEVK